MSSDTKTALPTKIEPDDPALTAPEKPAAADPPGGLPKLKILERVKAAERLAEMGLAVFPVYGVRREGRPPFVCLCPKHGACGSPGKHPEIANGVHAASRNFADLRVAWCDLRANIGVATGAKSKVWALDVDPRNGGTESLAKLEQVHGKLPTTWTARTGGGGLHYYFALGEVSVKCSTSKLGPGLDVKGDGGYVVAPPSLHRSGKEYEWEVGRSPDDIDVTEAPGWLLDLVTGDSAGDDEEKHIKDEREGGGKVPEIAAPATRPTTGKVGGPDDEDHDDGVIVEGSRNNELFSFASGLVREGVPKTEVLDEARAFNSSRCVPPLPDAEIQQVVDSAWRYASDATATGATNATATGATNAAADSVPQTEDPNHLPACTLGELWNRKFPEMRWCFENLLPTGLGLLVGRPKVGKSFLALQLASSVALGSTTLGEFKVGSGTALYCGLEDGPRRLDSRTKKQLRAGDAPTSTLFLLEQGKLRTLDRGGMDQLRSFLDKHPDCRLVVVDTLARFKGGRRPVNSDRYQDDVVVGDKLQRLALERDICLLFVHHDRKLGADDWVDTVNGSTGLAGSADVLLLLRRVRDGADATLSVTGRDIEERSFAMNFDANTGLWKVEGNATEIVMSKERSLLVTFLRSQGTPETPTNIAATLGLSVNNVKNLLWKMKGEAQVECTDHGKYFVEKPQALEDDLEVRDEELRRPRRIKK